MLWAEALGSLLLVIRNLLDGVYLALIPPKALLFLQLSLVDLLYLPIHSGLGFGIGFLSGDYDLHGYTSVLILLQALSPS